MYYTCISASDEELFEDNPEEYIRRDIEGSGMGLGIKSDFLDSFTNGILCMVALDIQA